VYIPVFISNILGLWPPSLIIPVNINLAAWIIMEPGMFRVIREHCRNGLVYFGHSAGPDMPRHQVPAFVKLEGLGVVVGIIGEVGIILVHNKHTWPHFAGGEGVVQDQSSTKNDDQRNHFTTVIFSADQYFDISNLIIYTPLAFWEAFQ